MCSSQAIVAPTSPRPRVWVRSEKQVTPITHPNAIGRAFSWIRRLMPVLVLAVSGSVAPAMKPATQANAWRASTREFRPRTSRTSIGAGPPGAVGP